MDFNIIFVIKETDHEELYLFSGRKIQGTHNEL